MKILHVLPRLDPEAGGPTTVALGLIRALNRCEGVEAEIVTIRAQEHETLPLPSEARSVNHQAVPVWFLPASRFRLRSFTPSFAFCRWMRDNIERFDLVHAHYLFSFTTVVAGYLALRHRKPLVVRPLGQLAAWSLRQRRWIKKLWAYCFDRPILRRAAFVHATSDQEARDIRAFGVDVPVEVLPPGIELPSDSMTVERDRATILFLGRLHPKKRPELAIDMIAELASLGIDATLVVAGSGDEDYVQSLKARATERVTFTGFVEGEAKWQLLRSATAFVLPSQAENFGVAVAEAAAAGCPLVLTSGVDIAETLAQQGAASIAEPTPRAFAEAVRAIVESPAHASQMGAAGAAYAAAHWSWERVARCLVERYTDVLATRSAAQR